MTPGDSGRLMRLLARGGFHSGEDLANELSISRGTIFHAIDRLRADGVPIHAVPGRGYRLAAELRPLDHRRVLNGIAQVEPSFQGQVEILDRIDSPATG